MEMSRFEWWRERLHTRLHRDVDECPRCRSIEYERWMQIGARALREKVQRGEFGREDKPSDG
jgi:hypothetical protein